jgi:hypothetical protein
VAPLIIPGRPPNDAVISPTMNAAYSPVNGGTPATKAKAIASGTRARATVNPAKISIGKFTFDKFSVEALEDIRFANVEIFVLINLLSLEHVLNFYVVNLPKWFLQRIKKFFKS